MMHLVSCRDAMLCVDSVSKSVERSLCGQADAAVISSATMSTQNYGDPFAGLAYYQRRERYDRDLYSSVSTFRLRNGECCASETCSARESLKSADCWISSGNATATLS